MTIIASLLRNRAAARIAHRAAGCRIAVGCCHRQIAQLPAHLARANCQQRRCPDIRRLPAARRGGEPVAYILGQQGFWKIDLEVAPHTLIPRPDTELLVETALELQPASPAKVLDLGTGTGAIALALASDRPAWQVTAVDRVEEAAALAERNRQRLGLGNAQVRVSHWFDSLAGERFDLIVSNPPYIAAADPHLVAGDVRFEPSSALVAGADGLDDLRVIAAQAPAHLLPGGWLLLEHGYDQAAAVRALLAEQGFIEVASRTDLGGHERITLGRLPC